VKFRNWRAEVALDFYRAISKTRISTVDELDLEMILTFFMRDRMRVGPILSERYSLLQCVPRRVSQ
jgi:hypothetical protein